MNPMILIGLGGLALMAMGGKKKPATKEEGSGHDSEYGSEQGSGLNSGPLVAQKVTIGARKATATQLPPLNYRTIALSQASTAQAKACHLQGMTDLNEITMCIAKKLFPNWSWANRSGWQNDAWAHMMNVTRGEMGLPPIIS